jgi:hypothetical protein
VLSSSSCTVQAKIRETAAQYRRGAHFASSSTSMQPPAARQAADRRQAPSRTALASSGTDAGRAPSRSSSSASLAESVGGGESSHVNGGLAGFGQSSTSVASGFPKPPRVAMGRKPLGGAHGSSSSSIGPAAGAGGVASSSSGARLNSGGVAGGGAMRSGRKSVAGVPMRVPGAASSLPGAWPEGGAGGGAAPGGWRGMPRRLLNSKQEHWLSSS